MGQMADEPKTTGAAVTVSVIVPVFEVKDYLDGCVGSIVGQTHEAIEVILVDDGSRDGSAGLCDAWAAADERVRVIHQENRGLSGARNAGIDAATGDFLAFVDADDTVSASYVETLLNAVLALGVPCVACGYTVRDLDGGVREYRPTEAPEVISARECFERNVTPGGPKPGVSVTAWCKLYRRQVFDDGAARFPEGEVYEDLGSMFAIVERSRRIGLIPDVLYHKHQREGSITQTHTVTNALDYERAMLRYYGSVGDAYPHLRASADRMVERGRIDTWMRLRRIPRSERDAEARDQERRLRREALAGRRDLILPDDFKQVMALWLIRWAPALVLPARSVWRRLRHKR
jgi:glycosyltransferase involved in cell wall biosynthesis